MNKQEAKADLATFLLPYVLRMKETQAFNKRLQEMGILASYEFQEDRHDPRLLERNQSPATTG